MKKRAPFREGKVHIMAQRCPTCIFRPGNLMDLEPGRVADMVREAKRRDSAIICHETLGGYKALCRGFFDKHYTTPLQIADRLGYIEFVSNTSLPAAAASRPRPPRRRRGGSGSPAGS